MTLEMREGRGCGPNGEYLHLCLVSPYLSLRVVHLWRDTWTALKWTALSGPLSLSLSLPLPTSLSPNTVNSGPETLNLRLCLVNR